MRLRDYIEFSGIEIANGNRIRDYLNNGLFSLPIATAECGCDATDNGPYLTPDVDNAPWVDSLRLESEQFLGMMATDVRLDSVITRSVTPKFLGGATIGKMRPRHRIISVTGLMFGQTEQAMSYGERWLTAVLAGVIVGCAPDTLRVLLACPEAGFEAPYRTFRRIGVVDGPTFSQVQDYAECHIQQVSFQIAAGVPYLISDPNTCLAETSLVGGS